MARLGVPVGGRVRKSRAVEDQSAPIPEERTSKLEGSYFNGEGARSTRAVGDQAGHPPENRKQVSLVGHFI